MPIGPPSLGRKDDPKRGKSVQVADGRLGVAWTLAYYIILVAGAVAFYNGFWMLTESPRALAVSQRQVGNEWRLYGISWRSWSVKIGMGVSGEPGLHSHLFRMVEFTSNAGTSSAPLIASLDVAIANLNQGTQ
jgi:hypothetical protein